MSLIVYAIWDLLGQVLESKYMVVHEAKVISAARAGLIGFFLFLAGLITLAVSRLRAKTGNGVAARIS
jgi:hypothetical protein